MNILVSTTRDWNLGDEIIWEGVKRLLDATFLHKANYFFYNRNPDLFPYRTLLGNYLNDVPEYIDLVVLAGTPEFYLAKMDGLYNNLGNRPVWAIGVCWGVEHLLPNEKELEIMKRDNFKFIVRSEITKKIIPKEVEVLPCPSLLCSRLISKLFKSCFVGDIDYNITNEKNIYVYSLSEFEKAKHLNPKYITETKNLINEVGKYDKIYTSRLHAGFAAIATGSDVEFTKSDFRIDSAVETWRNYNGNLLEDYTNILNQWKEELK